MAKGLYCLLLFVSFFLSHPPIVYGYKVKGCQLTKHSPKPFHKASGHHKAHHILKLTAKSNKQKPHSRSHKNGVRDQRGIALLRSSSPQFSSDFYTSIKIGSKTTQVVVDTGSSDLWAVGKGFQCIDTVTYAETSQGNCHFAQSLSYKSTDGSIVKNMNFNASYADGEYLIGKILQKDVTLAGIKVSGQQLGLVEVAAWNGDGKTSGLLGLAFSSITNAYEGDNDLLDNESRRRPYNPLLTNIFNQKLTPPVFSLALERKNKDSQGGYLAIGGLPPVQHSPVFAQSPFQVLHVRDVRDGPANPKTPYSYYVASVAEVLYSKRTSGGRSRRSLKPEVRQAAGKPGSDSAINEAVIDSATSQILLPDTTAKAVNDLFEPPADSGPNTAGGLHGVECSAKAPTFAVRIGTETFQVDPRDMIVDNGDGSCYTAFTEAQDGPSILGTPFLKNVVTVFDVGAAELRFAARENY